MTTESDLVPPFMGTLNAYTTGFVSTAGVTVESLTKSMRELIDKMPPASERVTRCRMNSATLTALEAQTEPMSSPTMFATHLLGLPIERDETLKDGMFVTERTDGTEVAHYRGMEYRRENLRYEMQSLIYGRWPIPSAFNRVEE